jgi:hypothetical protein
MKKLKIAALFSILFFGLVSASFAAPWKSTEAGKHKGAYINDPAHPYIVGEPGNDHHGEDLIMPAGKSGVIHQWFEGTSQVEGSVGHHSVWRPLKGGESCPGGWIQIYAHENYGFDNQGYDYCVKTNDYNPSHYLKNN